jgi:L-fuculose-phosphate aldolase
MSELDLRRAMVETACQLTQLGLNKGSSGNISVRCGDFFLVTPSGIPAPTLQPEQMVRMQFDGSCKEQGICQPSSEWRFHRDILLARPEIQAVIHTHSPFCTTLAVVGRGIPAFHYMVAVAGGSDIRCAPYATFGTQTLSDSAVAALRGRQACLLGNHGMIAIGPSLPKTLALTIEVETLAEQYWRALQIGQPNLLSPEEMQIVLEKFKHYGSQVQRG